MKLTIELERATDTTEETWVSHCLEIDTISQGPTPQDAIVHLAEAIDMMVTDEIDAHETGAPTWERAFANIADEIADRNRAAHLATMTDERKHAERCHPDWEYATTITGRKSGDSRKPDGDGWEPNLHVTGDGRNWERFDFHEEEYWMRRRNRSKETP